MAKVFITRSWPGGAVSKLEQHGIEVDVWEGFEAPPRSALIERAQGAAALITTVEDRIDDDFLREAGSDLRLVAQAAVGYDNIDTAAASSRGIIVTNTPGVLTDATADLAFALLMAVARRIVEGADYVREGHWKTWHPKLLTGPEVHRATVGIVGFGRIGQAFARRCAGFDMDILYASRREKPEVEPGAKHVEVEELLERSDFVSLHLPLLPETRHFIDASRLALMRPDAILINTARGGIVDTSALVDALESRAIGGAGLDVTEPEPLSKDHPLLRFPNVVVTPHIGSAGMETRARMIGVAVENCLAVLRGEEPKTPVS